MFWKGKLQSPKNEKIEGYFASAMVTQHGNSEPFLGRPQAVPGSCLVAVCPGAVSQLCHATVFGVQNEKLPSIITTWQGRRSAHQAGPTSWPLQDLHVVSCGEEEPRGQPAREVPRRLHTKVVTEGVAVLVQGSGQLRISLVVDILPSKHIAESLWTSRFLHQTAITYGGFPKVCITPALSILTFCPRELKWVKTAKSTAACRYFNRLIGLAKKPKRNNHVFRPFVK